MAFYNRDIKVCEEIDYDEEDRIECLDFLGYILGKTEGEDFEMFEGKGCPQCNGSGYSGRVGLYEFLVMELFVIFLRFS